MTLDEYMRKFPDFASDKSKSFLYVKVGIIEGHCTGVCACTACGELFTEKSDGWIHGLCRVNSRARFEVIEGMADYIRGMEAMTR